MSFAVQTFRPVRRPQLVGVADESDRRLRRRVGWAWGFLILNVLTYTPNTAIINIPSHVAQAITQGALPVALILALSANRRVLLRPNFFLCVMSLLVVGAVLTCIQSPHIGLIYRTCRLAEFLAVLWLLTPWWGRRDLLLVRCHLTAVWVVLGSVLLGLAISPGRAFINGRLSGIIYPIPCTQVAHYAAIATGLPVVLWLTGMMRGTTALRAVIVAGPILFLTHTRTALVAMVAGLLVAGLSIFTARARVRKFFAAIAAASAIGIITAAGEVTTWLERGQKGQQLTELTGRTKYWAMVLAYPRDKFQEIFGFGLSFTTVNGLPIDSNWFAAYMTQGLFGVAVCATALLFLLVAAYFQPRPASRAIGLFILTYCIVASFAEDGLLDASLYMLDVALAASLLLPSMALRNSE